MQVFGGELTVQAFLDEGEQRSIDILSTEDSVEPGVRSISTVGLSEHSLLHTDGTEFLTRVELCVGAPADQELWKNAVASAAFFMMQSRKIVAPGTVIEHIFSDYIEHPAMPHVYLTAPFLWGEQAFPELVFEGVRINWLQCMALYESERLYIASAGDSAFEDLLEEQNVDIFDLNRQAVKFPR